MTEKNNELKNNNKTESQVNINENNETPQTALPGSGPAHGQQTVPLIIHEHQPPENVSHSRPTTPTALKVGGSRKPKPRPLMLSVQNLPWFQDGRLTGTLPSANLNPILKRPAVDDSAESSGTGTEHHNISFASQPYFFQSPFVLSSGPNTPGKQKFFSESAIPTLGSASSANIATSRNPNNPISSSEPSMGGYQAPSASTVIFDNDLPPIMEHDDDEDVHSKQMRNRSYYIRRASKAFWKSTRNLLSETGHAPASQTTAFYQQKVALYQFLEYPTTWIAYFYHFVICMIILAGLIFYILSTTEHEEVWSTIAMRATDLTIATILIIEYLLRIWASSCIRQYQGLFGKLRFIFLSPFRIIDLILIAIAGLTIWASWEPKYRYNIYWLRAGHLFQILRLETRFKTLRVITEVISELKTQLWLTAYLCFLSLLTIASVVYFIEVSDENSPITNIPMALWYGIVTCFSIGYGDITPSTTWGKSVAGFLMVPSCIIWGLPAGLIATGLALKVERLARKKVWIKRQDPAARLIQLGWRRYATSPFNTHLTETWNQMLNVEEKESYTPAGGPDIGKSQSSSFLDLRSVFEDQMWLRKPASWLKFNRESGPTSPKAPPSSATSSFPLLPGRMAIARKNAIRAILVMKYRVAARKFHISFRPTDLPDLIRQYNETQNELLATVHKNNRVLSSIHRDMIRLEFVLRQFQNSQHFQQRQINRMEHFMENWMHDPYSFGQHHHDDEDYGIQMKPTTIVSRPETRTTSSSENPVLFQADSPFQSDINRSPQRIRRSSFIPFDFKRRRTRSF